MRTLRRTHTSHAGRLRHVRTLIAGAAATAAALSVTGLTATAQAQPLLILSSGPSVPAGVATALNLPSCPTGDTPSVSSVPTLPAAITVQVTGTKAKLVGVWPAPPPSSYAVKVTCSNGGGTKTSTVTVTAAAPEGSAIALGADTTQFLLDQFSGSYNATLTSSTTAHLYNWDSVNPLTGAIGDSITLKNTCSAIARPDGSSAGIKQLATFQKTTDGKFFCDNVANDARPRASTDPPFAAGGVAFVALGADAVTWVTQATTNAPSTLTPTQLNEIYTCTVPATGGNPPNNWADLGGKPGTIQPFYPQSGSGTGPFWLAAIGVTTLGSCVSTANNTLQQNEGVNPVLNTPNAIFIYSIGDYISQKFHSALCKNSGCTGTPPCVPTGTKNEFGCDLHGTLVLKEINGIAPTTGSGTGTLINTLFPATFDRTLYEVVPYDPSTTDHIPGSEAGAPGGVNLEPIFGHSGWACTNATAKAEIKNYGFLSIPTCGSTS